MSDASALRARTPHSSAGQLQQQADGAAAPSPQSDAAAATAAVAAAGAPSSASRAQLSTPSREAVGASDVELQSLTGAVHSPRSTATVRFHVNERAVPAASAVARANIRTTSKVEHEGAWASDDDLGDEEVDGSPSSLSQRVPRGGGESKGAGAGPSASKALVRRPSSFLEHHENIRTVLVWQNLTVSSPIRGTQQRKVLLDNVSGSMTGGMWAVMGPSGCGKSTLLNTLACRLDVNTTVTGEMRLNGRPYKTTELKKMSGYVMQDDLLNPHLTARETLHYTAALRLPAHMTAEQRDARVEEVIQEMGLVGCQHVIVGDPSKKGISGGERRRVCIGMELLTRPTLLFLDEPTSGLDSVTALALIRLLQDLTRKGKCSMLISIHQPQAKLFALFDRLLLLKSGRILFQGSVPACLKLFEECGFPVPHYSNPADHILDVITPPMDLQEQEEYMTQAARDAELSRQSGLKGRASLDMEMASALREADAFYEDRLGAETPLGKALQAKRKKSLDHAFALEQHVTTTAAAVAAQGLGFTFDATSTRPDQKNEAILMSKFEAPAVDLAFGQGMPLLVDESVRGVSWFRQLRILTERNVQEFVRKRFMMYTAIIQTIVMAVLIGTVFLQIGTDQKSAVRRQPLLCFLCINQGMFGSLMVINSFPAERALMLRERAAGTYYASAYFLSKTTVDTILGLPLTIIFSAITYFLVGLQPVGSKFIIFTIFMILCNLAATSLALMIGALCKTTDMSITVLPMLLEVSRLFSGFFLAPRFLPDYFSWLDALSYIKYAYVGISLNEQSGLELSCTDTERLPSGRCPVPDGQTTIDDLGLDFISMNGCIGVLFAYIIFCRIVAYLAVRFMKTN